MVMLFALASEYLLKTRLLLVSCRLKLPERFCDSSGYLCHDWAIGAVGPPSGPVVEQNLRLLAQ